jgi:Family of unknown function (DUF5856)
MATIMSTFLGIEAQLKVLHWQTGSYAKHQAFGAVYDSLSDLVDSFMEIYMGKYGRIALEGSEDTIQLSNIGELNVDEFINTVLDYLISFDNKLNAQKDSDLLNLRDEMMAEFNKLKYLLTLK